MKEISIKDLKTDYQEIADKWMLITAGKDLNNFNTMTASWGHFGSLWHKPTAVIYIRPQRYTKEFVDNNEHFSLCFFDEQYHSDLEYLGSHSGRNENKLAKTKLTPIEDEKTVYFKEANKVIVCRKLYVQDLKEECFIDEDVMNKNYPLKDYHTVYVAEIIKVLIK